jgi:hypothetical protein
VPGNAIDENCDRILGQFERVGGLVDNLWKAKRRFTRVIRLVARQVPPGARVEARCRGRGCPFRTRVTGPRSGRVVLHRPFRSRRLRVGAVVEVRITLAQTIGKLFEFKIRAGRLPRVRVLCLQPGESAARRC